MSFDPPRYERRLPDGTVEVYEFADRAASLPGRNIYLTQLIDPQGQALTFTYDAQIRLVAVTDALGLVTTLAYQDPADPMLLTKVTDPVGRFVTMTYNAAGQLTSITDAIGMTSRFAYDATDFVVAMTTPYGTTTFTNGDVTALPDPHRAVEVTDPEGGRERIEYHVTNPALSATAPSSDLPSGFSDLNQQLDKYSSVYWNKQAMAEAPGDLAHAVISRWLVMSDSAFVHGLTRNILHSVKRPLESRIWYRYPDQQNATEATTGEQPAQIARVLDDGSTQLTQFTYNDRGMATSRTDPLGRQTTYTYASNGIDLLEVRQTKPGGSDLLATYSGYTTEHQPTTFTDAAGQPTTTTYNAAGQPLTVTNAKNETTTYAYGATTGYLSSITGPVTGATTTYTYDDLGRVRTVTDSDGYTITTDYDALNRVTRRTYPDSTYEAFTYNRLDLAVERDRLGRLTRHFYDNAGRHTSTRDPLGRVIRQDWCGCGSLSALVDANGHRTAWTRDAEGRVITETRADGTTQTTYTYDVTGRLKTVTDPRAQVTTHTYLADDALSHTSYTNAVIATPSVS